MPILTIIIILIVDKIRI